MIILTGCDSPAAGTAGSRRRCVVPFQCALEPFTETAIWREVLLAWLSPLLGPLLPERLPERSAAGAAAAAADAPPAFAPDLPSSVKGASPGRWRRSGGDMLAALSWKWLLGLLDSTDPNLPGKMSSG